MIKQLRYLRKYDPNRDANSNWQTADELDFGWFGYSPFELQERYRDSGQNERLSRSLELEMQLSIRDRLGLGEIIALGVKVSPQLKDEAEQIPKILFQSPDVDVDWQRGLVSGLGRQFNDVRICLSSDSDAVSNTSVQTTEKAKRGRKSHSPVFEEAFALLEEEHDFFADWSQEKQTNEICEKAAALHPGLFRGGKPGRSTVYRFLQRRRARASVP